MAVAALEREEMADNRADREWLKANACEVMRTRNYEVHRHLGNSAVVVKVVERRRGSVFLQNEDAELFWEEMEAVKKIPVRPKKGLNRRECFEAVCENHTGDETELGMCAVAEKESR